MNRRDLLPCDEAEWTEFAFGMGIALLFAVILGLVLFVQLLTG